MLITPILTTRLIVITFLNYFIEVMRAKSSPFYVNVRDSVCADVIGVSLVLWPMQLYGFNSNVDV